MHTVLVCSSTLNFICASEERLFQSIQFLLQLFHTVLAKEKGQSVCQTILPHMHGYRRTFSFAQVRYFSIKFIFYQPISVSKNMYMGNVQQLHLSHIPTLQTLKVQLKQPVFWIIFCIDQGKDKRPLKFLSFDPVWEIFPYIMETKPSTVQSTHHHTLFTLLAMYGQY